MRGSGLRACTLFLTITLAAACGSEGSSGSAATGGASTAMSDGGSETGGEPSGVKDSSGGEAGSNDSAGGQPAGLGTGGMGGEASGGASPVPCDGGCKGDRSVCDEANDQCVGCLKHTDCEDPTKPMCNLEKSCVPCLDDFSCKDTLGLSDRPVCLNGSESLKTGEVRPDTGACAECGRSSDCDGAICEMKSLKCIPGTLFAARAVCDACTDDRECLPGLVCAPTTYFNPQDGPVGHFCLWRKDATGGVAPNGTCGLNSRPFSATRIVTTANGEEVAICESRTTTCPAIEQAGREKTGCDVEGDDDVCGASGFDDAICRNLDGDGIPECTFHCAGGDHRDCVNGMSCYNTGSESFCGFSGVPL